MNLKEPIKETEALGIIILFTDLPESKGRHLTIEDKCFILIDSNLSDIEAINVLLHERRHVINEDYNNHTYKPYMETIAEKERITDFFNLIVQEYPIDETFNIYNYMKNAHIEPQFEQFVTDLVRNHYESTKEK